MVCKNQSCKSDFCWVCLGPWEPHGSSWYINKEIIHENSINISVIRWAVCLLHKTLINVDFNIFRYNCNRYDEDEARLAREGQEKSRSALQRYLFYCNRYMNHLQSLKFENKLYSMVKVSSMCYQQLEPFAKYFLFAL